MACIWPACVGLSSDQVALVIKAAVWCKMAYTPNACLADPSYNDATTHQDANGDAVCIVFKPECTQGTSAMLVVAVRGTHTFGDVISDLEVLQVPLDERHPHIYVHAGFAKQAQVLSTLAGPRILAHLASGGKVLCAGHSLGAGVASIMAANYGLSFPGHVSFIGYGTPRQGNAAFAEVLATPSLVSSAICVRNHRDPVCSSIPPMCFPFEYHHAGRELCIGEDPFPDIPDLVYVRDHDIAAYIADLTTADVTCRKPVATNNHTVQKNFAIVAALIVLVPCLMRIGTLGS